MRSNCDVSAFSRQNVIIFYDMIRNSLFMTECKLFERFTKLPVDFLVGNAIRVSVCRGI